MSIVRKRDKKSKEKKKLWIFCKCSTRHMKSCKFFMCHSLSLFLIRRLVLSFFVSLVSIYIKSGSSLWFCSIPSETRQWRWQRIEKNKNWNWRKRTKIFHFFILFRLLSFGWFCWRWWWWWWCFRALSMI